MLETQGVDPTASPMIPRSSSFYSSASNLVSSLCHMLRVNCVECVFANYVHWGTCVAKHLHWVAVDFYHEHGFQSVFSSH